MTARTNRALDLLRELVVRDVRLRYRRRVLGLVWSQLGPLSMLGIFTVVFTRVIPLGIEDYPVFVFIGLTSWQWFQAGLAGATSSVTANRDLVRQPAFPVAVLPAVAAGSQLVHYVLALPIAVVAVIVVTGRLPGTAAALPLIIAVQYALCVGSGYLLATMHVYLRDTAEAVGLVLRVLFYATPIIYDTPRLAGSRLRLLYDLNPLAHLISAQRDVLLYGRWPDMRPLVVVAAGSAALAAAGLGVFRSAAGRFPDEV